MVHIWSVYMVNMLHMKCSIRYVLKYDLSMERLKIEEIANNYGMHLKNFAQRKVLADQINFALDFGMEYYQGGFDFQLIP